MTGLTYFQRNRDVILNRAKDYYENGKEILREQARDKYRNLSKEEKNKKREYGRNRYHNMPKNSEPVYNYKYIKTKTKICNDIVYTNFQHNKTPKDNEYCTCLSVILLDSNFVNSDKEYYP